MKISNSIVKFLLIFALFSASCAGARVLLKQKKQAKIYSAAQMSDTTRMEGLSFSPDGQSVLVASDLSKIFNLYRIDLPEGGQEQITHSTSDGAHVVSYFPNDNRILFSQDQGGNELDHIYVIEEGGRKKDLTSGQKVRARFLGWRKDDQKFWITTNERDAKCFDLYEYSVKDYSRKLIFKNTGSWDVAGVSPNGRNIALVHVITNGDVDLFVWDRERLDAAPVPISKSGTVAIEKFFSFSTDSQFLYYGTDQLSEFSQVWKYDLLSHDKSLVFDYPWDIVGLNFSKQGRFRAIVVNEDAQYRIMIRDELSEQNVTLPTLPAGQIEALTFSPDEKQLAFYLNGDTVPSDLYILSLETLKLSRLTHNLSSEISAEDLVEGERVKFASFDDLQIPAILYRPQQANQDHPASALVWVHGGPGGQSQKAYSPLFQYLINHGIAILAVNNRGSSGYGKTFLRASNRKHGDVDLKDCIYGKKYLESLDWIEKNRTGIMGMSYGGYIVTAAMAFAPTEFKVGIDIFGVTNWVRTLTQIPVWWAAFRDELYAMIGDPVKDREFLIGKSPLFHAEKIQKPLLVVQGANDPRVLKAESDEIVERLRKNQIPVEYLLFNDEGHGFSKNKNRTQAAQTILNFTEKYL